MVMMIRSSHANAWFFCFLIVNLQCLTYVFLGWELAGRSGVSREILR